MRIHQIVPQVGARNDSSLELLHVVVVVRCSIDPMGSDFSHRT